MLGVVVGAVPRRLRVTLLVRGWSVVVQLDFEAEELATRRRYYRETLRLGSGTEDWVWGWRTARQNV